MARIGRYAPPLALMALIFLLSAQHNLDSGAGLWGLLLRKAGHIVVFGLLWLLLWRAFGYERPGIALAIAVAYAASDELHQHFVSGRDGTTRDVLIDTAGMLVAMALALPRAPALRALLGPRRA
jgi:hypothetical protein